MPQDNPLPHTPPLLQRRANSSKPPLSSGSSFSSSSSIPSLPLKARALSARDVATMKLFQKTQLQAPQSEHTPLCRSVGIAIQRSDTSITGDATAANSQAQRVTAPFRRSHSKPENPTSNMGARAIEEASRATAHKNGKKLIFMRNFSVSEEDVVVCNRVRCGVNPTTLRQRTARDRRYLRSLSVEEVRLTATRRRASLSSMGPSEQQEKRKKTLVVREDEPFTMTVDPTPDALKAISRSTSSSGLLMSPRKISSPRKLVEGAAQKQKSSKSINELIKEKEAESSDNSSVCLDSSKLTPREKAMHGRYLIRESFANGSYGKVCAGESVSSHQEVAVKIVPKYVLISPEEKQSVIREQIIHKSLDHPHIIKLIDVFEDDGAHYFILERADSGSLSTIISYSGLPEPRCREVFKQLLLALEYLHRNNIVHHDIKPHNILLHKGDGIKLCDFGASRAFNKNETSLPFAGVFGTPGYIAPELLMGDATYGPAIDMFSAGVLLFEMVFGYAPFYPPSSCTYMPLEFPRDSTASPQVKHLLSNLLHRDPVLRLTASQALGHPWITLGQGGRSAPSSPVTSPRNLVIPRVAW
ncbi:Serine/threonine protein kinase [Globisporangium polare]